MSGALAYLDEQIEAVRSHLPAALGTFDAVAVHQSRVGTRRLKAGFDLLAPLLAGSEAKSLAGVGKALRRRLGPLRDSDVMLERLSAPGLPARLADAVDWARLQLEAARADARDDCGLGPKKVAKLGVKFDDWGRLRHAIESSAEAITPLLTAALHERFAAFAEQADAVSGLAPPPPDAPPVDVHRLRIDGKAVRYAFEIAAAHGLPVPKQVFKTFKAMQDALGDWHDAVVLAERVLRTAVDAELPLHRPALASAVLDLARAYLQQSQRSLSQFGAQWKRAGASIGRSLAEGLPLTVDADTPADDAATDETMPHEEPLTDVPPTETTEPSAPDPAEAV